MFANKDFYESEKGENKTGAKFSLYIVHKKFMKNLQAFKRTCLQLGLMFVYKNFLT